MPWINKDDLTIGEYNSLCSTYGLFDNVNYESVKYYKSEDGRLFELSLCMDGSLNKRIKE